MSCSHNKHKQSRFASKRPRCRLRNSHASWLLGGEARPIDPSLNTGANSPWRDMMHHVSDTKFWPHLPCTPCIFCSYRPRRRAKHCLPHICTSRTASAQKAAADPACQALLASHLHIQNSQWSRGRVDPACQALVASHLHFQNSQWSRGTVPDVESLLDLIEQVPLVLLARIPAGHQWLPAEPSFCFQLSESRTAPGTVAQPPVGTCQAAPDPQLACSWRWQPA